MKGLEAFVNTKFNLYLQFLLKEERYQKTRLDLG